MCGVFVYIGPKNNAPEIAFSGIKLLEYRGYDSWGVGYIPNKNPANIIFEKHIGKIGDAKLTNTKPSNIAFAHTRWATHGGVTDVNAHPHFDCSGKISVIHNGIVENYKELKEKLIQRGHRFLSETDTEIISHLVEENTKKMTFIESVFESFTELVGSNAIVVMDLATQTIVACRNGSPLVIGLNENEKQYFLGSDVPAFLQYTNKVHFLLDNEGVIMTRAGIKLFDIPTKTKKVLTPQILDWQLEDAQKGGFPHFLLKEINEQKFTIPKTAAINSKELKKIATLVSSGYKVILTGCGTASYCALAGKYFLSNVGVSAEMYPAYEFLPFEKFCNDKTIVIGISQSGETADTLIALRGAKAKGAHIVAVVNAKGSAMERLADTVFSVGAGPEIAVVSTKAFTSQLATLYLLSTAIQNKLLKGQTEIKKLGETLTEFMNDSLDKTILNLAKKLYENEHAFVIGKYINYPAALEFALKTKEAAYIHSEAFTAGELKHGVITLIQKGMPCFAIIANDSACNEVLSGAAELKARGGFIIGIAPFNYPEFDEHIEVPDLGPLSIFANVIVGQLLAYYLGIGRGTDPDKPRNLAKSVTVK